MSTHGAVRGGSGSPVRRLDEHAVGASDATGLIADMPGPGASGGRGPVSVSVSVRQSHVLVSLAGEADTTVRERLREPLAAAILAGARNLVIDAAELSYIDSACMRVLVQSSAMASAAGGTLALAAAQPVVMRVMELWGADQVIAVYASVPEAAHHRARPMPGQVPGPVPRAGCE
jgi:anti-sigma B factor antagonist